MIKLIRLLIIFILLYIIHTSYYNPILSSFLISKILFYSIHYKKSIIHLTYFQLNHKFITDIYFILFYD
jgi:hypothetical protein